MSLLEIYGVTPAPRIEHTALALVSSEQGAATASLPVRRDPDCPHRKQVQTPCKHHEWNVLYWNEYAGCYEPIHCYDCVITIDVCAEQPAPATVETSPVVEETAEPYPGQCDDCPGSAHALCCRNTLQQPEPVADMLTQVNAELAKVGAELASAEEVAATQAKALLPDNVEQVVYFLQLARRSQDLARIEQDTLIAELAFEADVVVDRERYFAARSGKYVLWHRRADMMAIDCSCGDRRFRGRRAGRACKHQLAYNATLKTAEAA